jgi:hypothetical protein
MDEDIPIKSVVDQVIKDLNFADARAAKLGVEDLLKYVVLKLSYFIILNATDSSLPSTMPRYILHDNMWCKGPELRWVGAVTLARRAVTTVIYESMYHLFVLLAESCASENTIHWNQHSHRCLKTVN